MRRPRRAGHRTPDRRRPDRKQLDRKHPDRKQPGRGFSLIEVLVAGAILLVIAIGLIPLFTQSLVSNTSGAESTRVSNLARSRVEEFHQLPFNGPTLTIDTGDELVYDQYLSRNHDGWQDGVPPDGDPTLWTRVTTVRQYHVAALADGVLDPAEALPGGTDPSQIHLKEVEVRVASQRETAAFGPAKQITLRVLKFK